MTEVLHLIDGHGVGHRAYHIAGGRGWLQAVGVFGQQLDALERRHRPARAVVVFDVAAKNWRHDLYPKYKADRPRPEVDLLKAMPRWKPLAAAMGWPVLSARGFEADDVIATLVTRATAAGWSCVIHASDKDLHALVDEHVRQVTAAGAELGPAEVEAKLGVPPARVADFLSLQGDKSDGVPGVPGCGEKNAAKLCREYPDIEAVIAANPKLRGAHPLASAAGADNLRLSRRLVELVRTVDLDVDVGALVIGRRDESAVRELLAEPRTPQQLELAGDSGGRRAPGFGRAGRWTRGHARAPQVPASPPPRPGADLVGEELEYFNERAGIRQHQGDMTLDAAERLALEDVEARRAQLARRSA
jgi:DNA polymerase-1